MSFSNIVFCIILYIYFHGTVCLEYIHTPVIKYPLEHHTQFIYLLVQGYRVRTPLITRFHNHILTYHIAWRSNSTFA